MKALRQLGFLKISLRPETAAPEEDHRVLELFRNRAELKKAYGELEEETYRLKDLVKQQEGATQRAQEMLSTLEARLGATDTAYPAVVFFQLRRLWQAGRELITQFVQDLVRQQDERERRAHLAQHNRRLFALRQEAQQKLTEAQALNAECSTHLAGLEAERARLTRFWHYFRRRALQTRIESAQGALGAAARSLAAAQAAMDEVERSPAPDFSGLSLQARRSINLAAIAYAEVLCLRVAELKTPLVQLAREATAQREAGENYGTPRECVLLMGQINRAHKLLSHSDGLAQQVRARGERLRAVVRYRNESDSAPVPDSISLAEGDALPTDASGAAAARQLPNVLAEDTWDLFRVLLR